MYSAESVFILTLTSSPMDPHGAHLVSWPSALRGDWAWVVLFCCVLHCLLFWVVFNFCILCIFNWSSVLYFPEHPTRVALYSHIVLMCCSLIIYGAHQLQDDLLWAAWTVWLLDGFSHLRIWHRWHSMKTTFSLSRRLLYDKVWRLLLLFPAWLNRRQITVIDVIS